MTNEPTTTPQDTFVEAQRHAALEHAAKMAARYGQHPMTLSMEEAVAIVDAFHDAERTHHFTNPQHQRYRAVRHALMLRPEFAELVARGRALTSGG